ncbi:hypothetical protein PIROE2DRAFT_15995 [Piromyces sp. E2]|nr:hypothetical protein PIROE2DRAFT_15995 [Piromyces sp. E2]|eukprot:OUM58662.1 hypothetical protein PIROE2DRAFT_15995 [Piromyces sp. E2]
MNKAGKKNDLVPTYGWNYYCRNDNCIPKNIFLLLYYYKIPHYIRNSEEESPVTHCDTIYKYFACFERTYIHCGAFRNKYGN